MDQKRGYVPRGAVDLNENNALPARIIPGPGREILEAAGFEFAPHPTNSRLINATFPEGWTKGPWENHPTKSDQGFCRLVGPDGTERGSISYNGSFVNPTNLPEFPTPHPSVELSVYQIKS